MGSLQHDLKLILELERQGQKRIIKAQEEAQRLLDHCRETARRRQEEGERRLAEYRQQRVAEVEADIAATLDKEGERHRKEEERLRTLAQRNREAAAGQILNWLRGEE